MRLAGRSHGETIHNREQRAELYHEHDKKKATKAPINKKVS